VVEEVTGKTWDAFVDERIFTPLGMDVSNTTTRALGSLDNVATPHGEVDGEVRPIPWRNIDNIAPAGSINSSADEMAEWLRLLLADGKFGGQQLIEPMTLREIFSPHTITHITPDTLVPSTHFAAYGLGVGMRDYKGVKLLQHTGGIDGMLSLVAFVPETDLGVVVLTNTDAHNNIFTALMLRVLDAYLGGPERDWSAIFLARQAEAEAHAEAEIARRDSAHVAGTSPSLPLEKYAGTYESELYGAATVAHENGRLTIRLGPFDGALEHWHYDTFRTAEGGLGGPAFVTFGLDARGRAATLILDLQGPQTFRRKNDEASR
ncbi:MAG: serine hydrolase, partial [Longimicrobiales bacterium]